MVLRLEAGPMFAAAVIAAAHAADGRDALTQAPSLLPIYEDLPSAYTPAGVEPSGASELEVLPGLSCLSGPDRKAHNR
jgi:hypothetical protein